MNQRTFRMRRRVGAALLAGVTALGVAGVAALAGEGVANAAVPSVSAASLGVTTISGSATQTVDSLSVTITGSVTAGDHIVLTLACPSTGVVEWASVPTASDGTNNWATGATTSNSSCTFNGVDTYTNVLTLVAPVSETNATVTISGISYTTIGAPSGTVSISGEYETYGGETAFSVPSNATVSWFGVQSNVPATTLSGTSAQSVGGNVTVSVASSVNGSFLTGTAGTTVTVKLILYNAVFASTPTFSVTPPGAVTLPTTPVTLGTTTTANDTAIATFTTTATTSANLVFSGLSITPNGAGPVTGELTFSPVPTPTYTGVTAPTGVIALGTSIAGFQGPSNRIYGQNADDTVAQEFEAAFPVTKGGNKDVVLATGLDPYDALSAAYLEAQLGTGLLITDGSNPYQFTGTAAAQAIQLEGVTTVYVVGGQDAIPPSVISQIESTSAYNVGGVTTTGSDLKVVGPIYGQTADDTAQSIATYFGTAYGAFPAIPGAYNGGVGTYNDTTGISSTTAPSGAPATAFVISDTDWRDATTLGPIAYAERTPIILTQASDQTGIGTQATAALTSLDIKQVIAVGGQLAFPNAWVSAIEALNGGISVVRIAGSDYTDTAAELAKFETSSTTGAGLNWFGEGNAEGYLLSHGDYWSDALGAASIGGQDGLEINGQAMDNEPILTTENPTTEGSPLTAYISSVAPSTAAVNVLGGPDAVTANVVTAVQTGLSS